MRARRWVERVWVLRLWILLLLICSPGLRAEIPNLGQSYLFDRWQIEEGLPQITVYTVAQGPGGYLWLGTEEGLARFDGVRFTTFNRQNTPQLQSQVVWALLPDEENGLWIGTLGGGLSRWQDGQFFLYTTAQGLVHDDIQALHLGREGTLWVGTRQGLSHFDGEKFTNYTTEDGLAHNSVNTILEDGAGDLWVGTESGLSRLRYNGLTIENVSSYTTADGLSHHQILALEEDGEGSLWVGTFGGLDRMVESRVTTSFHDELAHPTVRALHLDHQGELWIGTEGGLSRLVGEAPQFVQGQPSETQENLIWSLAEDREGSLWIGTRSGGLLRMRPRIVRVFGADEGLADDLVWAVLEDREDNLWFGTNRALTRLGPGGEVNTFANDSTIRSIFEDSQGELWFGTKSQGVGRLEGSELQTTPLTADTVQPRVNCFAEDRDGNLWAGTNNGIFRRQDGQWRDETATTQLPNPVVRDLLIDRLGALWIVMDGGLNRYHEGSVSSFDSRDGLLSDSITTVFEDGEGSLWIGTRGGGLARLRDGEIENFNIRPGYFDVYQILEDDMGRLWSSSNLGISSVEKRQLEEYSAGNLEEVHSISYGLFEGMRSRECNGGSQPAGWKTRSGHILFPTLRGAAILNPRSIEKSAPALNAVIEEAVAGTHEIFPTDDDRSEPIAPGTKNLEFHYTALSFLAPEKIEFRYRLEGFDEDWIDAGTRRTAFYTNLAPGDYHFQVMARWPGGPWSPPSHPFTFYLRPTFRQTPAFYLIAAAATFLLLWGLHRLRVRALLYRSRLRMLEAKNEEMERFTYTVSHDLKSPLVTIRGFLGLLEKDVVDGRQERVKSDIERIYKATDQMSRLLEDLLRLSRLGQAVDAQLEKVELSELARDALDLVAGQIAERGVEVVLAPDLPVVLGDRRRLLQVLQNLIDNAVKFMGSQAEPRIEIGVQGKACFVRDNGIGIAPHHLSRVFGLFDRINPKAEGTGIGLALVERIIRLHNGRVWVESEGLSHGSTFYFTIGERGRVKKD